MQLMSNSGDPFLPLNSINGLQIVCWIQGCIQKNYMICSMLFNAQWSSTSWYQPAFYSCIFKVIKHVHKILSIRRWSAPIKPVLHDMDIWYLQNQTAMSQVLNISRPQTAITTLLMSMQTQYMNQKKTAQK